MKSKTGHPSDRLNSSYLITHCPDNLMETANWTYLAAGYSTQTLMILINAKRGMTVFWHMEGEITLRAGFIKTY